MSLTIQQELKEIEERVASLRERVGAQPEAAAPANPADTELLKTCLELLERATLHDGRYSQQEALAWQSPAQKVVRTLSDRLGVRPYAKEGESHGPST